MLEPLQPYFRSRKGISHTSLRGGILTRFAIIFFPTSRSTWENEKITTDKLPTRTKFQHFLNQAPCTSFKKLIISTPSLLQGLHTMSLLKSVLEGFKPQECKRTKLHEPPPVPYVPTKGWGTRRGPKKMETLKSRPPLRKTPPSTFQCGMRTGLAKPSWYTWRRY